MSTMDYVLTLDETKKQFAEEQGAEMPTFKDGEEKVFFLLSSFSILKNNKRNRDLIEVDSLNHRLLPYKYASALVVKLSQLPVDERINITDKDIDFYLKDIEKAIDEKLSNNRNSNSNPQKNFQRTHGK